MAFNVANTMSFLFRCFDFYSCTAVHSYKLSVITYIQEFIDLSRSFAMAFYQSQLFTTYVYPFYQVQRVSVRNVNSETQSVISIFLHPRVS